MRRSAICLLCCVAASVTGAVSAQPIQSTEQKRLVLVTTWVHKLTRKAETREVKLYLFDPARVKECNEYLKARADALQRRFPEHIVEEFCTVLYTW
jgi:hypothetical protein